mmetsp:Transcript_10540/g.64685  ORF Transcript_10540/g.64685 Transcript_10540/m.64685 type:complete len:102 (+) Transcript_10540:1388-1693(+)
MCEQTSVASFLTLQSMFKGFSTADQCSLVFSGAHNATPTQLLNGEHFNNMEHAMLKYLLNDYSTLPAHASEGSCMEAKHWDELSLCRGRPCSFPDQPFKNG